MFLDPWQDVGEIKYDSCGCADRMREGLEGEGAEIEWQTLERCVGASASRSGDASACAGRKGIFRCPLGMCDLCHGLLAEIRYATAGMFERDVHRRGRVRRVCPFLCTRESVGSAPNHSCWVLPLPMMHKAQALLGAHFRLERLARMTQGGLASSGLAHGIDT